MQHNCRRVSVGLAVLLIEVILFSASAHAQQFWGKTKYGMSPSAVKALFGNKLKNELQEKPLSSLVMETRLCEAVFSVQYTFDSNKLIGVNLSTGSSSEPTVGDCVYDQYVSAFGKPDSSKRSAMGMDYIFHRADTVVTLSIWPDSNSVFIVYRVRRSDL